jgi:hypothetical protein
MDRTTQRLSCIDSHYYGCSSYHDSMTTITWADSSHRASCETPRLLGTVVASVIGSVSSASLRMPTMTAGLDLRFAVVNFAGLEVLAVVRGASWDTWASHASLVPFSASF